MIGRALAEGVRSATRRPGLVALLWAWNLALAGLAALPFWSWAYAASSASPRTDALLDGLNVGLVAQLIVAAPGAPGPLMTAAAAVAALALVSGAFLSGGILEVLLESGDDRPLLHRFFRGAGHFFGRFLRLLFACGITLVPVTAIVAALLSAATSPLQNGGSEPAAFWAGATVQVAVALTIGFFLLALDYARVITVATDARGMSRTWMHALRFVARRLPAVATIGLAAASGVTLAIAGAAAFDMTFSARGWGVIVGTLAVHQAAALVRTAVRVGQIGAQARYWTGLESVRVPVETRSAIADAVPTERSIAGDGGPTPAEARESVQPEPAIGAESRRDSE
jgi:hypothetical protein